MEVEFPQLAFCFFLLEGWKKDGFMRTSLLSILDSVFVVLRQGIGSLHFLSIAKQRLPHKRLSRPAVRKVHQ